MKCNWLWDAVTINSNGSVSPCCGVEDAEDDFAPAIDGADFHDIWNSRKFVEAREHILGAGDRICAESDNVCLRCDHAGLSNHMDVEHYIGKLKEEIN
jgi:hypothetical protein